MKYVFDIYIFSLSNIKVDGLKIEDWKKVNIYI